MIWLPMVAKYALSSETVFDAFPTISGDCGINLVCAVYWYNCGSCVNSATGHRMLCIQMPLIGKECYWPVISVECYNALAYILISSLA